MQNKLVLISDDSDFYEYIVPKLALRKSDELFKFSFSELPEKIHLLSGSLLIINSEKHQQQTLELLDIIKDAPVIIFSYNDNDDFKIEAYKRGMFDFFTPAISDKELNAKLVPALKMLASIEKNDMYRNLLVKNNLITKNNEVFLDFTSILDQEFSVISKSAASATLLAISPDDKTKFLVKPNQIETIILNNIRKNDVLMNYSPNKYFLLLKNADLSRATHIWNNLQTKLPSGLYAGIAFVGRKSRQQVVSEALNNLHTAINSLNNFNEDKDMYSGSNFKFFRQDFNKKIEKIISPVFYHIQQIYNEKLFGVNIEQGQGEGYGVLYLKSKYLTGVFKVTSPGFSTVNIDISYELNENINKDKNFDNLESKRISLEPEELDEGLINDLIEQFISEFKNIIHNEYQV